MASSAENRDDGKAPAELSAPEGWKKTILPKKSGTPKRNAIVFISPTGEEFKSKRQLDLYLKSHPGGPSSSEFDWSTGETPRRSRRLSDKSKATESPESEPPRKRQNKSSSGKVEDDADGEDEAFKEKDDVKEENKASGDVEMKDEDAKDVSKGEGSFEDAVTAVFDDKNTETDPKSEGKDVKGDEIAEDQRVDNKTTDGKDEQVANNLTAESVANKEEIEKQKEAGAPLELENEKADEKAISNSEEKIESVSLPTQDLDDGKEGTEKQPAETEAREPVHNEKASLEKDGNLKESQDGSRPTTTYAIHHEEKTPHEPKASQVSC